MADEPSIDEILASLDELLKEGEGSNDEPAEVVPPPAGEPSSPQPHDAPTPHFFEVLDDEVEAGSAHEGESPDAAEPRQAPQQADETPGTESGQGASRLVVLTDAMMVEDQPSLPLAMGDEPRVADADEAMRRALSMPESGEPEAAEPEPEAVVEEAYGEPPGDAALPAREEDVAAAEPEPVPETEPEPEPAYEAHGLAMPAHEEDVSAAEAEPEDAIARAPAWDADEVQALVDQVTDDVCSAMAEQLPEMIRMALAERLSAFIEARAEQQDTGNQE